MKLPNQSAPVVRNNGTVAATALITPSGIPCDLCLAACNQLGGFAKTLCIMACNSTVC